MSIVLKSYESQFRYVSEWDPTAAGKKTKGGYLEGKIFLPTNYDPSRPLHISLETVPDVSLRANLEAGSHKNKATLVKHLEPAVHPLFLHVVRMGKGSVRLQDMEPVPAHVHWRQEFVVENKKLYILNKLTKLDDGRNIKKKALIGDLDSSGKFIRLSKQPGTLNLILMRPTQSSRAKDNQATVEKVINNRLEQYVGQGVISRQALAKENIAARSSIFTGCNAQNMNIVRLRATFRAQNRQGEILATADTIQPIIHKSDKNVGVLEFYEAFPLKSCTKGRRKVIMLSDNNLSKEVKPMFIAVDRGSRQRREKEEIYLNQIVECTVRNNALIFLTPIQDKLDKMPKHIDIQLTLSRKKKGMGTGTEAPIASSVDFQYIDHDKNGNCIFCHGNPDEADSRGSDLPPEKTPTCPKRGSRNSTTNKRKKDEPIVSYDMAETQKKKQRVMRPPSRLAQNVWSEGSLSSTTECSLAANNSIAGLDKASAAEEHCRSPSMPVEHGSSFMPNEPTEIQISNTVCDLSNPDQWLPTDQGADISRCPPVVVEYNSSSVPILHNSQLTALDDCQPDNLCNVQLGQVFASDDEIYMQENLMASPEFLITPEDVLAEFAGTFDVLFSW